MFVIGVRLTAVALLLAGCNTCVERDNAYNPDPCIGVSETVSVGDRGTQPGGLYSGARPESEPTR